MKSEVEVSLLRSLSTVSVARVGGLIAAAILVGTLRTAAQSVFSSGSDGTDGEFNPTGPPGTVVLFDPSQFQGSQVAANIFNFTTITIPQGVTVKLSGNVVNGPVYWLAQGDVNVRGTIDLSGGNGHAATGNAFERVPSIPGSGGYSGGVGALSNTQGALPGNGPGGGAAGTCQGSNGQGSGGQFSGNQFLIPLIGGSGGGGGAGGNSCGVHGAGGGAGGGALMIASSTQITIDNGALIAANGGNEGGGFTSGGGGSGGGIRLVSNNITITGQGVLSAVGGGGRGPGGDDGFVRLEAASISFLGAVGGNLVQSTPFPLLLPTEGSPLAKVISIGGVQITPDPSSFPDIVIDTTDAIPVVIQTRNIPVTATVILTILNQIGVADTVITAPPLGNCDSSNICTTTVNVVFPFGASRGLTKVTWTP